MTLLAGGLLVASWIAACSPRRYLINSVGDALVSGPSVFESEGDLELLRDALPFSLKLMETLVAGSPANPALRLGVCRGYVLYSSAFVDFEAEVAYDVDLERSRELRSRARRMYLRALDQCLASLEIRYPGFAAELHLAPEAAAARLDPEKGARDLPSVYWSAAALGLAIRTSLDDATMLARLPEAEELAARALEIDETWGDGALHELNLQLLTAAPGPVDDERVDRHYRRALQLSQGQRPSLFVAYAESVAVPSQDREEFRLLLQQVLAFDPDADPANRLTITLAQRRARWLLQRIDDLILDLGGDSD